MNVEKGPPTSERPPAPAGQRAPTPEEDARQVMRDCLNALAGLDSDRRRRVLLALLDYFQIT